MYFTIAQSICNGLLANQLKLHLESHKNGGKYFNFNFFTIVLYWWFKKYLEYMTCATKSDMNVPKIVKFQFSNYPGYPTWTRGTSEFLISWRMLQCPYTTLTMQQCIEENSESSKKVQLRHWTGIVNRLIYYMTWYFSIFIPRDDQWGFSIGREAFSVFMLRILRKKYFHVDKWKLFQAVLVLTQK